VLNAHYRDLILRKGGEASFRALTIIEGRHSSARISEAIIMRFSPYYIPVILGLAMTVPMAQPASAQIAISISVPIAPPPLPVYVQPPLPAPGYIWTPGYWAYADDGGYYWVPGTWVEPPSVGVLWTPPWWGFEGGVYGFHAGYWGPHIGFYGGINYGFGYNGVGFFGGRWDGGVFAYNRGYNNFGGTHITNVYQENIVNNNNHVSFNGGNGGIQARPTAEQAAAEHEQHIQPTGAQMNHFHAAAENPALRASTNHGRPEIAATARPGEFSGPGAIAARSAGPGAAHSAAIRGPAGAPGGARPGPEGGARAEAGPRPAAAAGARPGAAVSHAEQAPGARPAAAARAPRPAAQPHPVHQAVHAPRPAAAPRPAPHPVAHAAPRPAPHPAPAPHGGGGGHE
jgi:hypothetical protein